MVQSVTEGTNYVIPAGATVRGDYIIEGDGYSGQSIAAVEIANGGDFYGIIVTGVTVALGDPAYSAVNGQVTNVSGGGAAYLGKFREAGLAGNLCGITLQSVP